MPLHRQCGGVDGLPFGVGPAAAGTGVQQHAEHREVEARAGDLGHAAAGQQGVELGLGARTVDVRRLHDAVVQKIDARNASFWLAKNGSAIDGPGLGLMERQRLKMWMNHAYAEITRMGA